MKLGMVAGYSGKHIDLQLDKIKFAETLGYETTWTAEAYGSDAVSPAAWILASTEKMKVGTAIMQMPGRTPALAAMTAMTLNQLSKGRFIAGLGASGPQVVEGWHGIPYGRPITRTREYIAVMRKIMAREGPATFEGHHYNLPYKGDDSTGLGKPLKSILAADTNIPIYTASITPNGVACAAEIADGFFPVWMNPERYDIFADDVQKGLDKSGRTLEQFDIAPFVTCIMGDNLDACRMPVKGMMALYIGGMGARSKNFYNDYAVKLGYADEAKKIQDLYLDGKKAEAMAAVPDALVDDIALIGPKERIKERLQVWKEAGKKGHVGSMLIGAAQNEVLELIAEEML
ncbi:MAG: LLM class F420-dependent oxidoreductase [Gammaproteobacteria bacterium]|nr:MAG: LLM class F420-dependent oxidoreductase [Gammaproteobacteria bacterium]